jgi:hypothetical protein
MTTEAALVRSNPILGDLLLRFIEGDVPGTNLGVEEVFKLILHVGVPVRPLIGLRP